MITCIVNTSFKIDSGGLPWESSYVGTHPQSGLFICILQLCSLPILIVEVEEKGLLQNLFK